MNGGQGTMLERLYYLIGAETGEFDAKMAATRGQLTAFGASAGLAKYAGMGIGAGLGIAAAAAYKFATEFETSFAEVKTILGETDEATKILRDDLLELSERLPESAAGLTRGYYEVVSAGITDAAEAFEVLEVAAKLAAAGLTTTFTTVDALTTLINACGLAASDAGRLADQMFETVRLGKIRMEELAGGIGKAAPFFAELNVPTEELFGAISTLTKNGIQADIALTALRGVIMGILKPQKEAVAVARQHGIELDAAAVKSMGFWKWLSLVNDKVGDNSKVLAQMFGDVRELLGVLGLTGDQAKSFASDVEAITNSLGAADRAFSIMEETTAQKTKIFWNRVKGVLIDVGTGISAAMGDYLEAAIHATDSAATRTGEYAEKMKGLAWQTEQLLPVADEYDALMRKQAASGGLNAQEQERLAEILRRLKQSHIPGVITAFDQYGNALTANTKALRDFVVEQKTLADEATIKAVREYVKVLVEQHEKLQTLTEDYFKFQRAIALWTPGKPVLREPFEPGFAGEDIASRLRAATQGFYRTSIEIERTGHEAEIAREKVRLFLEGRPEEAMLRRYMDLRDAIAAGGTATAAQRAEMEKLAVQLQALMPEKVTLFDPATLKANEELLGQLRLIISAIDEARAKAAKAELPEWGIGPEYKEPPSELEAATKRAMQTAEDAALQQQREYAAAVMGVTTATLDEFRVLVAGMEEAERDALAALAEDYAENIKDKTKETLKWIADQYRQVSKEMPKLWEAYEETGRLQRRELIGPQEKLSIRWEIGPPDPGSQRAFEQFLAGIEAGRIEIPVGIDYEQAWRDLLAGRVRIERDPVTQIVRLVYESEVSAATRAADVLGGEIRDLGRTLAETGQISHDVVIPALRDMMDEMMRESGGGEKGGIFGDFFKDVFDKVPLFGGVLKRTLGAVLDWGIGKLLGTDDAAKRTARGLEEARKALEDYGESVQGLTLAETTQRREQLQTLADEWAETLADFKGHSDKAMGPFVEEWGWLMDQLGIPRTRAGMRQLDEFLRLTDEELEKFEAFDTDTVSGALERLRMEFELFDVDDPIQKWKRLREEIEKLTGVALPDLDLRSAEGRQKMETLLKYLSGLEEIPDDLSGIATTLGLPLEQVRALLETLPQDLRAGEGRELAEWLEGILDEIESGNETSEEQGEDTITRSRQVTITEAQGDTMISLDMMRNRYLQDILSAVQAQAAGARTILGDAVAAPSYVQSATPVVVESGSESIEVGGIHVHLTAPRDRQEAVALGAVMGDEGAKKLLSAIRSRGGRARSF